MVEVGPTSVLKSTKNIEVAMGTILWATGGTTVRGTIIGVIPAIMLSYEL